MTRRDATYTCLATLFAVVLVLTNIVGVKLFVLFPDGGPAWILGGDPGSAPNGDEVARTDVVDDADLELLASLDVLENWEYLMSEDVDLLLGGLDSIGEVVAGVDGVLGFEESNEGAPARTEDDR